MKRNILPAIIALLVCVSAHAQVNNGSNGSDGAFNPTTNPVINMADHPTGIYQYTSVNISNGVTVMFIPNANNTPVVWLVQSNCLIQGTIDVSAQDGNSSAGGPGGYHGAYGGVGASGQGPGSGSSGVIGGNASFGSLGTTIDPASLGIPNAPSIAPGPTYGNIFLLPLMGGSGGGGTTNSSVGGTGGGGARVIDANLPDLSPSASGQA